MTRLGALPFFTDPSDAHDYRLLNAQSCQHDPERALRSAVLESAIRDVCITDTGESGQALQHNAAHWIHGGWADAPYSFVSVCEALHFDPQAMRAAIDGLRRDAVTAAGCPRVVPVVVRPVPREKFYTRVLDVLLRPPIVPHRIGEIRGVLGDGVSRQQVVDGIGTLLNMRQVKRVAEGVYVVRGGGGRT